MSSYDFNDELPNRISVFSVYLVGACQTANQHAEDVLKAETKTDTVTVASVQREIRIGISGAEVIKALGSPNIITTDEKRREVWVYDKISTTEIRSESSTNASILIVGGGSFAGVATTSQRTFTVIIK